MTYQETLEHLKKKQSEVNEAVNALELKKAELGAAFHEAFGFAPGETADIVKLAEMVRKVAAMP